MDPADKTKWTFTLRPGVTFHDGSDFTADAVVWNLDKLLKADSAAIRPAPSRAGQGADSRRWRAIAWSIR